MRDERLAWAEAKLLECRRMALRLASKPLRIERKPDGSPVTKADRDIEDYLRRELGRAFPGDLIIGEEFSTAQTRGSARRYANAETDPTVALSSGSFWTIDPIDGTRAFSRGLPSWGILLGRVERGKPVVGACDFPVWKTFMGVGRGTPAYERRAGQRRVLPRAQPVRALSEAVILHGGSAWWQSTRYAGGFRRVVKTCFLERSYGDCYAYLWLFRGRVDAVLDYGVKIWDLVPLAAVAASTGHVMTDCSGRPTFTGPESIVAHPSLNRLIRTRLRSRRGGRSSRRR